ncbi:glutamate-1-semialdehyde aminotransferase [Ichthyobacterium seriolicida]|uniref:Glutamate-1-semialdehyde 2,1-aminomutase n=2 Tax=Ichthyobacterium seriolicida TaxID=242600 RepID=A0A1J1DWZ3_9FLAO|nr:glutamate-1-semialdehyde aminotransferase [Ichthyobacterium seriolicida]
MHTKSNNLFKEAKRFIPGGVNSPVRAFKGVGGKPVFIRRAKGAHLYDEDGNVYIDYINSWGPMILGHASESVINAITEQVRRGTSFGTPTEIEVEIAKLIIEMCPFIDMIRMVNSGTEACMSAIRLARAYTNRDKFIKFEGCYHGHSDSFLIKAGSGAMTFGTPSSPGVTSSTSKDTLLATYNDIGSVKRLIEEYKNQIAAIILEPVAGNMGCIPPVDNFLSQLRELCDQNNIVLIFDEVMTGFRLSKGGAQEFFGVKADLVTYGKIIGGGMPVGAFAGKSEIMNCVSPVGDVYQAGTLSGNPMAMIAGYTVLKELSDNPDIYKNINEKTAKLESEFISILSRKDIPFRINRVGSMISIFFCEEEVESFNSANTVDTKVFNKFFHHMLSNGVYLPPSAFETWFICNELSNTDIEKTVEAVDSFSL